MANPPATPPSSDIEGVNMDGRAGLASRDHTQDPGAALKHEKDESKAKPNPSPE